MFVHGGGQHGRRKLLWQFTVAIKSDPVTPDPVTPKEPPQVNKALYMKTLGSCEGEVVSCEL